MQGGCQCIKLGDVVFLFAYPLFSSFDFSNISTMPFRSVAGTKKKSLALKEVTVKKASTSQRATSKKKDTTQGKEDQPPVMAAPISAASSASTAPTSVGAAATNILRSLPREEVQAAEIMILRGKHFHHSLCASH